MFNFFDDFFRFFDLPENPAPPPDQSQLEDAAEDAFDHWQDANDDFFDGLADAAKPWGSPAQDFVSAWQQATESFADQFAHWFGWDDNSPV